MATLKKTTVKKPLTKAQSGGSKIVNSPDGKSQGIVPGTDTYKSYSAVGTKSGPTPYQDYMKRPGADGSDTLVKSGSTWAGYNAKNPKNNKALIKAVKATNKISPMKKGGVVKKPLAKAQYGRAVVSTDKESNYTASGKKIGTGFGKKAEYRNFATGDGDTNYAPTKAGRAVKNEVKASNRAATKSGNIVIKKTGGAVKSKKK